MEGGAVESEARRRKGRSEVHTLIREGTEFKAPECRPCEMLQKCPKVKGGERFPGHGCSWAGDQGHDLLGKGGRIWRHRCKQFFWKFGATL